METVKELTVHAGFRPYRIIIGEKIASKITAMEEVQHADKKACIVSVNVYGLHRAVVDRIVSDLDAALLILDDSEANKNYLYGGEFLEKLLSLGLTRKSLVVSIGGGVTGDFSGFCAALYMRGIPFVQVPTTLLAMVDASIGGKVAVNLKAGKNIAGAFHQPVLVVSDIAFLETLPAEEMKNGLTEILKHGLIGDGGTMELLSGSENVLDDRGAVGELVYLSARFKAKVVERDEKEGGVRAILNFGHTFGHALESLTGYTVYSHGQAVAAGIRAAARLSEKTAGLTDSELNVIEDLLEKYSLETAHREIDHRKVYDHMAFDKKNEGGRINLVLLDGIGRPLYNQRVESEMVLDVLKGCFS